MKKILYFILQSTRGALRLQKKKAAALLAAGLNVVNAAATAPPDCQNYGNGQAQNITYKINGNTVASLGGNVSSGDTVSVCFTLSPGSDSTIFSLVSYKAPSATFNTNTAPLQTVFDVDSKTVYCGGGTFCLSVVVPSCYFQVDFVTGCVIYQLGPPGSGNYYSDQGRLIDGDNGGSGTCNCVAEADAGADVSLACGTGTVSLQGSTYVHGPLISWQASGGGHIVAGAGTLNPTVDMAGTYVLAVTDSLNCTVYDTVHVSGLPIVVNLGSDTTMCGGSLVLDAGNPGSLFSWNTGITTQTLSVSATGTYVVSVYNGSCTATDTIQVTILSQLNVDLGNDTAVCTGSSLTLNAGNAGSAFVWSTGAITQSITVSTGGSYAVTVSNGTCMASDTIQVTVLPGLYLGSDTSICAGSTLMLDAGNVGSLFFWSTGATTQIINVSASGSYYVSVYNGSCLMSDTINVTVLPPVVVELGNDTTVTFCQGSLLLNAGISGMSYLWSTGAVTQMISVTSSGTYSVLVTDMNGCYGTDSVHVTVNPGQLSVDLGNDTMYITCSHQTLTLNAGVSGGIYVWNTGATTQTISVGATGNYFVSVTDSLGCLASDTISVTVFDNTIDVNLGPDTTVCGCILLYAGYPGATYSWCTGQNYSTINACWTANYCVTVSNGTCMDSDTIHVTVNPIPTVNLGNDTVLVGGSLILDAGIGSSTYLWNTGDTTQTITVSTAGSYYVTITNAFGCSATDTIQVGIMNGVAGHTAAVVMHVYPNPSTDKTFTLSLQNTNTENVEVQVVNTLGMVVYTETIGSVKGACTKTISLASCPAGLYFVAVTRNGKKNAMRMVLD